MALINGDKILCFSQSYKSLTQNLFSEILKRFEEIGQKPDYNKTAMTISFNGGICYGYSYENHESCRGLTEVKWLFLDEVALAPIDILAVAGPCCRGNFTPMIRFCSTPRAGSYWNRWIKEGMLSGSMDVFTAKMSDNTFISKESIELAMNSITDPVLRKQELEGEIIDSVVENCIISFDLVSQPTSSDHKYVIGADMARFGNDSTVIIVRNSFEIVERVELLHADTFEIASTIDKLEQQYRYVDGIYIDATGGYGAGVEDTLKLSHDNVIGVNFGSKATDEYSFNMRSEIYFNLAKALEDGFYIDKVKYGNVIDELYATSYFITPNGKRAIVPKDKIKEIIGHSPDTADALALTFYKPNSSHYMKIDAAREKELMDIFFR